MKMMEEKYGKNHSASRTNLNFLKDNDNRLG